AQPPQQADFL
nr:RecName: Full=52 kDa cell wall protein [Nicotiana tabacum]